MTGEFRYLEKYSVAPAPSRDYYGIRILRDEVKLFLWKISHGPHRTPIVRSTSFADFQNDKFLHEEILRVFGIPVLEYVRDVIIAGKTDNSEENSCGLTKGWNRVFKEGQLMQQAEKSCQYEKKRCVRAKGRIIPTSVKGNASSKVRAKIVSKTPLEVIKKNSVAKKSTEKSLEETKPTKIHSRNASAYSRQVTEVSEKILRTKITKIVEEAKKPSPTARDNAKAITESSTIDNIKENVKFKRTPSDSTISKTSERLTKGLSTVKKKNVDLTDLIHEVTKKNHERSSSFYDSYFSCLEDIERSNESLSENNVIENPWSANSSIASINSFKEAIGNKESSTKLKSSMSPIENSRKFSTVGTSATRTLDTIDRLANIAIKNTNINPSKNLSVERTTSGLSKNQLPRMEKASVSGMKTNDSRMK